MAEDPPPDLAARLHGLIVDAADRAEELHRMAVRPIYAATERGEADQIGSSVLLAFDDAKWLLTAAHIIDDNAAGTLYVGGVDSLIPINCEFLVTTETASDRDRDHHDVAIARLPQAMIDGLGTVSFIAETDMMLDSVRSSKRLYTVLGYPNSKNKGPHRNAKVRGQLAQYSSFERFQPKLARRLGISGDDHLFVDHRKYSLDQAGRQGARAPGRQYRAARHERRGGYRRRRFQRSRHPPAPPITRSETCGYCDRASPRRTDAAGHAHRADNGRSQIPYGGFG